MSYEEAKRQFMIHFQRAMNSKKGSQTRKREIKLCNKFIKIGYTEIKKEGKIIYGKRESC